jgi:hypothetical protein
MKKQAFIGLAAALFLIAGLAPACAASADLITIKTPRGVKQAFILIKPERPVASVILLAGGHGALGLKNATAMRWGAQNFLVRSRAMFAGRNLIVAVMDAPSDRPKGMNAIFRMSAPHAADITAVAAHLKKEADLPVWLVGTSMGTFSAAEGAIAAQNIDGLVLSSTITRSKPDWKIARSHSDGIASMALEKIAVPTLILSHRHDQCDITPAADAAKLKQRLTKAAKVSIVLLDGGKAPKSEACDALAAHGFWGIEEKAVDEIARFVTAGGA